MNDVSKCPFYDNGCCKGSVEVHEDKIRFYSCQKYPNCAFKTLNNESKNKTSKPKTNFDRIKQLTLDEFAEISEYAYDDCLIRVFSKKSDLVAECAMWNEEQPVGTCKECFKKWLQSNKTYEQCQILSFPRGKNE